MSNTGNVQLTASNRTVMADEATSVLGEIQSQIGRVSDLYAMVSQLLAEIAALQPPNPASYPKDKNGNMTAEGAAAYGRDLQKYHSDLNRLNGQLRETQTRLEQAKSFLSHLQNGKLPDAKRHDAERLEKDLKQKQEALNNATKTAVDDNHAEKNGESSSQIGVRLERRKVEMNVEVKLHDGTSLKSLCHYFELMAVMVSPIAAGNASPERRFNRMPPPAGGGLPPVGTP